MIIEVLQASRYRCGCFKFGDDIPGMTGLAYTKNPKYHEKIKYIDIKYHYIRNMVAQKKIDLRNHFTSGIVVDLIIKAIKKYTLLHYSC